MYNVKNVTEALRGLIGFRAHNDPTLDPIDSALTGSKSGLWLDRAQALITAVNLSKAANALLLPAPEQPPPAGYVPSNSLSLLISTALDDSVAAVLSALRTRKLLRVEGKIILPKTQLFEGEGSISDTIQPAGRFNVLELTSDDSEVALNIGSFGIQLTGPAPQLRIWTISGNGVRVLAKTVATTYSGRMQWFDLDQVFAGEDRYMIGYLDDDLPVGVQAIRRAKTIGNITCPGCDPPNATLWNRWSPYLSVRAARQDSEDVQFDYIEKQNFGMNLTVNVGCDIGPLLINQQMQLAEAIQQQAVVKLLKEIAYSSLITTTEQQVRQNAMFALQNGEEKKLETLLDALDVDFSGLSSRCLPDYDTVALVKRKTVFNQ